MTGFCVDDTESVLVAGAVLSGRRRLVHRMLYERPETTVVVSTRQPAAVARSTHWEMALSSVDTAESDVDGADPVIIDCVTSALGESQTSDDNGTWYAADPSDLTSIGTMFTECLHTCGDGSIVVGVDTISPLLVYAGASTVFQFLNLLVQKATAAGCPVVVGIDAGAHDEQTIEQFVPIFETVIETRRTDEREGRVRYPTPGEWQAL